MAPEKTRVLSLYAEEIMTYAGEGVWMLWGRGSCSSLITAAHICATLEERDQSQSMVISKILYQLTERKKKVLSDISVLQKFRC